MNYFRNINNNHTNVNYTNANFFYADLRKQNLYWDKQCLIDNNFFPSEKFNEYK